MATGTRASRRPWYSTIGGMVLLCLVSTGCPKKSSEGASDGGANPQGDPQTSTEPGGTSPAEPLVDAGPPTDINGQTTTTCSKPADCAVSGACPADALAGCTCVSLPGGKACLPRCSANRDCPKSSETVLACSAAGLCIPASKITLDAGLRNTTPAADAKRAIDTVGPETAEPDVQ